MMVLKLEEKKSEAKGKLRGIGVSSYFEACGIAPSAVVMSLGCGVGLWESSEVRFNPTGNKFQFFTGAHSPRTRTRYYICSNCSR